MKTTVIGDDFAYEIRQLGIYSREVMLEQLSKAGNDARNAMREALKRKKVSTVTRVRNGKAYLSRSSVLPMGHRESHSVDRETSSPDNMASMITSFISEPKATVVVNGMHPRFTPLKRRNGVVVGTMPPVNAVSPETHAILIRLNSGQTIDRYPSRSRLSNKIKPSWFVSNGISASSSSVRRRLTDGYEMALKKAPIKHKRIKEVI